MTRKLPEFTKQELQKFAENSINHFGHLAEIAESLRRIEAILARE